MTIEILTHGKREPARSHEGAVMRFERIGSLFHLNKKQSTPQLHDSIASKVSSSTQRSRDGAYMADLHQRLRRHRDEVGSK